MQPNYYGINPLDCFKNSLSKGFWDGQLISTCDRASGVSSLKALEVLPLKIALIHSEIDEAFEQHDLGFYDTYYHPEKPAKPEGFHVEIADVAIRIFDLLGALGETRFRLPDERDPVVASNSVLTPVWRIRADYDRRLNKLHGYVSAALEAQRSGGNLPSISEKLLAAVDYLAYFGSHNDHVQALSVKMAYNSGRPTMHGKAY
jgi:hypothetical protein